MKKLTKKALPVIVCLLLVVSAISGTFGISAETVVNDKPLNLDFSDDLNHWLNTDKVKVNDGAFTFEQGRSNWVYLTTEEFKIPDAAVGDTITLSMVVTLDSTLAASDTGECVRTYFDTTLPNNSKQNKLRSYNVKSGAFTNAASGVAATTNITVQDPDQTFSIRIAKANGTAGAYTFSDIKVINMSKISDEENPSYGTEADGFVCASASAVKPLDKALNLDFQNGLRYWCATSKLPSEIMGIKTEGTNKYAKIKGTTIYRGVQTPVIKLSNVQAGDKVTVVYDWKGSCAANQFQVTLTQYDMKTPYTSGGSALSPRLADGHGLMGTKLALSSTPAGWTTVASRTLNALKAPENGDANFYAKIGIESMVEGEIDFCVDNIRLAKVSADGKVYTDLVTNQVIYDANTVTTGGSTTGGSTTKPGTTGAGATTGTFTTTGDSILMLAALFFVSGAGVFGTAKALKNR